MVYECDDGKEKKELSAVLMRLVVSVKMRLLCLPLCEVRRIRDKVIVVVLLLWNVP